MYSDVMTNSQTNHAHGYDEDFEWGYSHSENVNHRGELAPIPNNYSSSGWFTSRGEAQDALWNDLRWRVPTFLIRRPRPAQPEIIGRELLNQEKVSAAMRGESDA